jgi:hypothetical protein
MTRATIRPYRFSQEAMLSIFLDGLLKQTHQYKDVNAVVWVVLPAQWDDLRQDPFTVTFIMKSRVNVRRLALVKQFDPIVNAVKRPQTS